MGTPSPSIRLTKTTFTQVYDRALRCRCHSTDTDVNPRIVLVGRSGVTIYNFLLLLFLTEAASSAFWFTSLSFHYEQIIVQR